MLTNKMETHECLDLVLKEYKDYFSAKDLAQTIGIAESNLSKFRKGKGNMTMKIFDRLRRALNQISPSAYLRFISLLANKEMNLVTIVAMAPPDVQGQILKAIASSGVFRNSRQEEKKEVKKDSVEENSQIPAIA